MVDHHDGLKHSFFYRIGLAANNSSPSYNNNNVVPIDTIVMLTYGYLECVTILRDNSN